MKEEMTKLSPTQRKILERLAAGEELYRAERRRGGCFPPRFRYEGKNLSHASVDALLAKGLIESESAPIGAIRRTYTITDEGRKALL